MTSPQESNEGGGLMNYCEAVVACCPFPVGDSIHTIETRWSGHFGREYQSGHTYRPPHRCGLASDDRVHTTCGYQAEHGPYETCHQFVARSEEGKQG